MLRLESGFGEVVCSCCVEGGGGVEGDRSECHGCWWELGLRDQRDHLDGRIPRWRDLEDRVNAEARRACRLLVKIDW